MKIYTWYTTIDCKRFKNMMSPRPAEHTLSEVKHRLQNGGERIQSLLSQGKLSEGKASKESSSSDKHKMEVLHRGISLGFLIALTETFQLQDFETHRVVKEFIKPVTACKYDGISDDDVPLNKPCRFAELECFQEYFGKAHTFVSHCWNGRWGDLVAAVSSIGHGDTVYEYPLTRVVWMDIFAVTQHPQMDALQDDLDALQYVIANAEQGTTLVWNPRTQTDATSNPVLRAWCLFEIHTTLLEDNALLLKMGSCSYDSKTNNQREKDNNSEWLDFIPESDVDIITKLVFETDIRNAKATVPADLQRIHQMIENTQGGFDEMNTRVRTAVYNNWRILQVPAVQAALSGSKELIMSHLKSYNRETYEGDPGGSMLHDLVHGNLCDAAEMVIECGAPVDHQTDKGNTPLMFAAEGGGVRMCQLLVEKGEATLNLQNGKKETALHLASKYGRVKVVNFLLENGADRTLRDSGNYTPAGLASMNIMPGCKEVSMILDPDLVEERPGDSSSSFLSIWCWC